jgi:hypothetical protein
MRRMRHFPLCVTVFVLAVLCGGTGFAWVQANYRDWSGMRNIGLHLNGTSLTFLLEQDGSFDISDGSDLAAIRASFSRLNGISTTQARALDGGTLDYPSTIDSEAGMNYGDGNRIYFFNVDSDNSFQALAASAVWFDAFTGAIGECDIAFNNLAYQWSTATPANPNQRLGANTYDIEEVANHEIQHCYGFDHSAIAGRFSSSTGLQVSGFYTGDFSMQSSLFPYATGTIQGRSLKADDVAAYSSVYPSASAATSFGAITGKVLRADGSAVKGAHVVAVRVSDPARPVTGTLSGAEATVDPGGYRLTGLPPGSYYVRIEPLVGTTNPFTELDSVFGGFDTSFPPEFYSGGAESAVDASIGSSDAAAVQVTAGTEVRGVDFIINTPKVGPAMSYLPVRLAFVAYQGGGNPAAQMVAVRNIGSGTADWGLRERPAWLVVSPASGTLTASAEPVSVSVNVQGLAAGTYRSKLLFFSPQAANSPQAVSIILVVTPPAARIRTVCPTGCAYSSIQAAIDASSSGDTIQVGAGRFIEHLVLKDGVQLLGAGPELSIIDAGGSGVVVMCASNSLLDGFTITGAINTSVTEQGTLYTGAAIKCKDVVNVTISHNLIMNNLIPDQNAYGAGLFIFSGGVQVLDNVFRLNSTGLFDAFGGTVAGGDGTICIWNGGSTFDTIYHPATIARNRIVDNLTGQPGGIYAEAGGYNTLAITDNLIAHNEISVVAATFYPGGIDFSPMYQFTITAANNTIVDNFNGLVPGNIGGVSMFGWGTVQMTNTILWGNTYWDGTQVLGTEIAGGGGGAFDVNYSIVAGGYSGTGNSSAEPLFRDRSHADYRLRSTSPGIDTGNNAAPGIGAFDLAGIPRIVDGNKDGTATVDIGAFEFGVPKFIGPVFWMAPGRLNFPPQALFTSSKPQAVTLFNAGDLSAKIAAIAMSGDFAQTNDCGASLRVGTRCTGWVTFKPTLLGPRSGSLTVLSDAGGTKKAQLWGFGVTNSASRH